MPHSRSAKKRMRQSVRRNEQNRRQRAELRTTIKNARAASGSDAGEAAFRAAEQLLDRGARKGLVHPNAAARTKARLRHTMTPNDG